ncbi:MAG: 4Fe-4S binding protein [Phycisphaerales bacterium]|nr:MAG: 4Fe-4S binding protein [Phycisphaerales bacterium]
MRPPRLGWRFWRRFSQVVFLLAFLWLFRETELRDEDVPGYVNIAFRLDPLVAASAMLAAKALIAGLLLCLITVGVTLLFGRAFCGWVCPAGTLLDLVGKVMRIRSRRCNRTFNSLKPVRYWLLIAVLLGAAFGFPLVGYLDPFSILNQGLTLAVDPALSWSSFVLFDWLYQNGSEGVTNISEPIYAFLGEHVLAFERASYTGAWLMAGIVAAILLLERVQRRFWCRYLCPLGAMLGFIARLTPFGRRPAKACAGCLTCEHTCRMDAFDESHRLQPQACTVCMDCVTDCPNQIAQFLWFLPRKGRPPARAAQPVPMELSRRAFLGACAVGVGLPAVSTAGRAAGVIPSNVRLLRPPGALEGDEFLDLCVRCGECLKVCLTNGLQPVMLQAGPNGLFSPQLVPRTGYCEYNCLQCIEVCPTGAIRPLDLAAKQKFVIGEAVFDEDLCLPFAEREECIVCEEHCPIPTKAIRLKEVEVETADGQTRVIQEPFVDLDLCNGCGICENKCPLDGAPGIYVRPVAEEPSI